MNNQLLILGHNFPEPNTTAAGSRMMQLIELFQEAGYQITFASTARHSKQSFALLSLGIEEVVVKLNSASFDDFIFDLHPSVVVFDRYITEEKFGWRVIEQCPNALRILDTEDLHFLRKAREEAILKEKDLNLYTETAKRELASILRCDLSLIISEVEMELLQQTFRISSDILYYLPFLVNPPSEAQKKEFPSFESRTHFVTIGNFLHAPNADAIKQLKKFIWPKLRKLVPQAELHIYGTYAPQYITEMHNEKEGFLLKGWAPSLAEVMQHARVSLAPIRFGAGLKGKLLDAMCCGTPSVTTEIGAEGMHGDLEFSGSVCEDMDAFVSAAAHLYDDKGSWMDAQEQGFRIISERFQKDHFSEAFIATLEILRNNLDVHRRDNFIGQILQQQSNHATKYMSKWIEEKNK